jgi:siderophore synthetase component
VIWFFDRGGERLRYEIRRAASDHAYELTVTFPDGRTQREQTSDAAELLERCAEIARKLQEGGWRTAHQLDESNQSNR